MIYLIDLMVILFGVFIFFPTSAFPKVPPRIWKITFRHTMPNRDGVTTAYCQSHSPNTLRTTADGLLKGVKSDNAVFVKYKNYKQSKYQGLYFLKADAVFTGVYENKTWHLNTFIQGQMLKPNGIMDAVWSNRDCKGKFTAKAIDLLWRRSKG